MVNSLHAEFHYAVIAMVNNFGPTALGVAPQTLKAYTDVAAKEQDCVKRPIRSDYTETLNKLDEQRNELLGAILTHLSLANVSLNETVQASLKQIQREILEQYPISIKREAVMRKTTYIRGLLVDLERIDEDVFKAMGLKEQIAELGRLNTDFDQAYLARNTETNERVAVVVKELRSECNRLYQRVCTEIEYIAGTSDEVIAEISDPTEREKRTAQRTLALNFVTELNRHITHLKAHYFSTKSPALDDGDPEGWDPNGSTADGEADGSTDGTDASDDAGNGTPNPGSNPGGGPTDVTEVF